MKKLLEKKNCNKYLAKILLSFLFIPMEGNHKKKLAKYFSKVTKNLFVIGRLELNKGLEFL